MLSKELKVHTVPDVEMLQMVFNGRWISMVIRWWQSWEETLECLELHIMSLTMASATSHLIAM